MNTQCILKTEGCLTDKYCIVCQENFINVTTNYYNTFYDKIKEKYKLDAQSSIVFEDDTTLLCYDDRFQCITCNTIVCCGCLYKMPDYEHGKRIDNYATYNNYFTTGIYTEIYTIDDMEHTGIITCPFCANLQITYTVKNVINGNADV